MHSHRCRVTICARRICLLATSVLAVIGASAVAGPAVARTPAHAASSMLLKEHAQLRLTSRQGIILNEKGPQGGTLNGTLWLRLTTKVRSVHVQWAADPSGGWLKGDGWTNVQPEGAYGRVTGSINITSGSGRYSHAHGSGLRVTGTVNRHTYALTIYVTGRMYY